MTDKEQDKLYALVLKSNTHQEISTLMKRPIKDIKDSIQKYFPHLKDLALYKAHKTDLFQGVQSMAIRSLIQRLPHANTKDLTYLIAILEDKINLREGRSTSNIALSVRIEDLVEEKERIMNSYRDKGVPEDSLDTKFREHVSLDGKRARLPLKQIAKAVTGEELKPEQDKSVHQRKLKI